MFRVLNVYTAVSFECVLELVTVLFFPFLCFSVYCHPQLAGGADHFIALFCFLWFARSEEVWEQMEVQLYLNCPAYLWGSFWCRLLEIGVMRWSTTVLEIIHFGDLLNQTQVANKPFADCWLRHPLDFVLEDEKIPTNMLNLLGLWSRLFYFINL